mgnify:CR=1 FL=1
MIKKLPILFICFLSSCQNTNLFDLDLASAPKIAKESLFGFDIKVDQAFIDSKQFSFMKLTLNKRASILSLSEYLTKGDLIVIESTCPVGTTNQVCHWLSDLRKDLKFPHIHGADADINISHSPER